MSTLDPQISKLLGDILKSSEKIVERLENMTEESFSGPAGEDIQDIVARRLTIIGEASAALLKKHPEFCENNSHIPLRQAKGMRNILVHDYDGINWQVVWNAAKNDLTPLIKSLAPLLNGKL